MDDKDSAMRDFKVYRYLFDLQILARLELPSYIGSTLRGVFGRAFRRVSCSFERKSCSSCLLKNTCAYSYVFETPVPVATDKMRKYTSVPHPFVIEPPLFPRVERSLKVQPGDAMTFNLVLIGKSINYLPYFILAFIDAGKMGLGRTRGKFKVSRVIAVDGTSQGFTVYKENEEFLSPCFPAVTWKDIDERVKDLAGSKRLLFRFVTPTRLVFQEDLVQNLSFHQLFRTLIRRLSLLSYFHTDTPLDIGFADLIEDSVEIETVENRLSWVEWSRFSSRQERKIRMGGLVGEVVFEGDFRSYLPYLAWGEKVHVGKGTVFGLGKYELEAV